jgi:hypothetical protein
MIPGSADRKEERKKGKKENENPIGFIDILINEAYTRLYTCLSNGVVTNEYLSSTIWVRHNRKHHHLFIL